MRASWSVLAALFAGCSGGEPVAVAKLIIRDSAGIQIVEYPAGYEETLPTWDARGRPLADIGAGDGPAHELDQVRGAARLSDGRIVVANGGSDELRVFDSTGKYLSTIGRHGQGPGEFIRLGSLERWPGDTIVAMDVQIRRFSVFAPSGELVRSRAGMVHKDQGAVLATMLLRDDRLLGLDLGYGDYRVTEGPVRREPRALVLFKEDGKNLDTIAVFPGGELYPALGYEGGRGFPTVKQLEFGKDSHVATDGYRVYLGTNEAGGIGMYHIDGTLARIIRTTTPLEPVTPALRQRREKDNLARIERQRGSGQLKAERLKNLADARYADSIPSYENLLVDDEANLWVERFRRREDEGRRYIVFDSTGRAIARVLARDRVRPFLVSRNVLVGLWHDADDVNHVLVFRVSRKQ